ncbi:MAG: hypothetical protein ACXVPN_11745 [Bacteroidia bacterium]
MFRKQFILTVVLAILSVAVLAQPENATSKTHKNFFYVAPADLFLNTLQLGYERKLCNYNTFAVLGGFKLSKKDELINRIGGNGELQYRINLLYDKEALSSIIKRYTTFAYFAPYVQYRYEEITDIILSDAMPAQTKITMVNSGFAGLGFGFRLTAFENRFCINAFAGGGLKYSDINGLKKYDDFLEVGYTGIAPKIAFQMGIAF